MSENLTNAPLNGGNEEETVISLTDIWNMVWNYKWWYIACTSACLVLAAFHLYRTPETYQRTAKVIIDDSEQSSTVMKLTSVTGSVPGLRANSAVANEIEAFSSPDLMQKVVEQLGLETRYFEKQFMRSLECYQRNPVELRLVEGNPKTGFAFTMHKIDDNAVRLQDFVIGAAEVEEHVDCAIGDTIVTPAGTIALLPTDYVKSFGNDIRISWNNSMSRAKDLCGNLSVGLVGKESTVIAITLEDTFASRAADVISALIDAYNNAWLMNKNRSARNTSKFINERLLLIEKELGGVESELKAYKEQNKLSDMNAIAQKYIQESSEYSSKLFEANNQLSIANFIRDYLNNPANASALIPANLGLTSANVESQISEYNELVLQKDRLSTGSGDNNPLLMDLNSALMAMRTAIIRSIDNFVTTLELQVQKLESQENQIMERIAASSGQELQLLSIQRQQMVKESLYVFLLQKREENEIAALVNVGNTRLVMRPDGSGGPVGPNKMMILLMALVFGCGIPFGVIFLMRMLDTTVRGKADFARLSVPFLAEIPLSSKRNGLGYHTKASRFNDSSCRIVVQSGRRDVMNEAFRVLRTNFDMAAMKKPGEALVAMLTSINPNAGKTFVGQNIAASMALKGSKVLIVDLDLRKGSMSKYLDRQRNGFESYLSGKETSYKEHIDLISPNLYMLPVGKLPPNPVELLQSDRFAVMMEQLRKEYDYIFLDCPPIDIVADATVINRHADMTVFIVRANLLDKKALPYIETLYRTDKFKRMALVLNGVDFESRRYTNGYGYGYGYGYGNQG